jgi:hypothetical protein
MIARGPCVVAALLLAACSTNSAGASAAKRAPSSSAEGAVSTFCARGAGTNDEPFCVPEAKGPSAAYEGARAAGAVLPVQMWVPYPDSNLDAFVGNADELKAWIADVKTLTKFLNDSHAESYGASLEGNLGDLMKRAKDRQEQILQPRYAD